MNWIKHIFSNITKEDKEVTLHKKELFDTLYKFAKESPSFAFLQLHSNMGGLSDVDARNIIKKIGLNDIASEKKVGHLLRLFIILKNPLNVLLLTLGIISLFVGDVQSFIVITFMVGISVCLNFFQETKAGIAADKLKSIVHTQSTVVRDGKEKDIPSKYIAPGDIISLYSGSIIPGDVRILESKDLFINQIMLTGESMPVEKHTEDQESENKSVIELQNICFYGTSVESGTAKAIVLQTGKNTYLGNMADDINSNNSSSDFNLELKKFVSLTLRFMLVMVPIVFLLNGFLKHNWFEAFLFAMAVAVGVAPEMIPTIVAVNLSKGALILSKKKIIVKHLDCIENLGVMDVLCTDKTGTLTDGKIVLEKYLDIHGVDNENTLKYAFINSYHQTGMRNLINEAILKHEEVNEKLKISDYIKIDELPFDFYRRRTSVIVSEGDGKHKLICIGAVEETFSICTNVLVDGKILPIKDFSDMDKLSIEKKLNGDGFRVVAVSYKEVDAGKKVFEKGDESELIFVGFLAFFDPPKQSAMETIKDLRGLGVTVKILTGDNDLVTRKICSDVGVDADRILLGKEVEAMTEADLLKAVEEVYVFAKLSPYDKEKVIKALRKNGHIVGFLGDGINDSLSLIAADVGISVDTAADIAKESSDLILLEKSLLVLKDGIVEGRRVFDNITKYLKMAASSNFGNMLSVVGASIFLPFLPMIPIQILTNNILYDFSQMTIPTDNVDEDHLLKPKKWDFKNIQRFILFFGPISSIFDYATFFVMICVFHAWGNPALFQTGWFVESLLTQTLIVHIIRTSKIPFIQSRASWPLIVSTIAVIAVGIALPFSPFGPALGLVPLSSLYFVLLTIGIILYFAVTQILKMWFIRKYELV